jgi:hypothetical protein
MAQTPSTDRSRHGRAAWGSRHRCTHFTTTAARTALRYEPMNGRAEAHCALASHETASATRFVKDERSNCPCAWWSHPKLGRVLPIMPQTPTFIDRRRPEVWLFTSAEARDRLLTFRGPRGNPRESGCAFRAPHDQRPSTHPKCLSPAKTHRPRPAVDRSGRRDAELRPDTDSHHQPNLERPAVDARGCRSSG